ncbi:DUF6326 family protein [Sediminibacterium salmoneum]|uniref:DUF6326 family protein n=1 Tax=Sediminibacterium salmoneum TaxID=426421 RepID=UPI00047B964C|nr:DUF6326 family protein [Sediminibacterium salmoneum]
MSATSFIDTKVNVKLKLAALWASFMFLYIYVDYFHLYMPGMVKDLLAGKAYIFDINQTFIVSALLLLSLPILMIYFSVALPARLNRIVNLIVATFYIPFTLFNLSGMVWIHMVFAAFIEVFILFVIIGCAWKWPVRESFIK